MSVSFRSNLLHPCLWMGRGVLYCSTRGGKKDVLFEDVVLAGLAPDKGLYVPQEIPRFTTEEIEKVNMGLFFYGIVMYFYLQ